jgi:hypothetical protein
MGWTKRDTTSRTSSEEEGWNRSNREGTEEDGMEEPPTAACHHTSHERMLTLLPVPTENGPIPGILRFGTKASHRSRPRPQALVSPPRTLTKTCRSFLAAE